MVPESYCRAARMRVGLRAGARIYAEGNIPGGFAARE